MDAAFDGQFIDMMVPHHHSAVEMAKIALERAEHHETKILTLDTIAAQGQAIS